MRSQTSWQGIGLLLALVVGAVVWADARGNDLLIRIPTTLQVAKERKPMEYAWCTPGLGNKIKLTMQQGEGRDADGNPAPENETSAQLATRFRAVLRAMQVEFPEVPCGN